MPQLKRRLSCKNPTKLIDSSGIADQIGNSLVFFQGQGLFAELKDAIRDRREGSGSASHQLPRSSTLFHFTSYMSFCVIIDSIYLKSPKKALIVSCFLKSITHIKTVSIPESANFRNGTHSKPVRANSETL